MKSREAASWVCYWIAVKSVVLERALGRWFEWPYHLFAQLIRWSDALQGDGPGPWSDTREGILENILRDAGEEARQRMKPESR